MNTRNKITLIAAFVAVAAFSTSMLAQPSDAKIDKKIEHRIEKMKTKLALSDAQVTQVKAILEEAKPQMKADWQKMKAAPKDQKEAVRADLKKDRDAVKVKLLAVLNPDQRAKAEKYFERHEHKHKGEQKG